MRVWTTMIGAGLLGLYLLGCSSDGSTTDTVTVTEEPPGPNCPNGGTKHQVGTNAPTYVCDADQCVVDAMTYSAGILNPANACEICQPSISATGWTHLEGPNSLCAGATFCHAGTCTPGCWIDATFYPQGMAHPADGCRLCQPDASTTTWSPAQTSVCTGGLAPVADAGADRSACVQGLVTLDGSGSSDPEMATLSYTWAIVSVPGGSSTTLTGAGSVSPSFTADTVGTYVVSLFVNDGRQDSALDLVSIAVQHCEACVGNETTLTANDGALEKSLRTASTLCLRGVCLVCALGSSMECGGVADIASPNYVNCADPESPDGACTLAKCLDRCIAENDFGDCPGGQLECDPGETCDAQATCRNDDAAAVNDASLPATCAECFTRESECSATSDCRFTCLASGCECDSCLCETSCISDFSECSGLAPRVDCTMLADDPISCVDQDGTPDGDCDGLTSVASCVTK